jgi:hypothetical protein
MKRKIVLALATGLALLVAGCASDSTSGGGSAPAQSPAVSSTSRNFNLAIKCPGVHWEKTHGWSDQQIMEQESLDEQDIPACEQWVQAQPKGYVPPPPGGAMAAKAPSGAPSPAAQ